MLLLSVWDHAHLAVKTGPKSGFRVWEAKCILGGQGLVFIICLKRIFLGPTKFGRHKRNLDGTAPNAPSWLRACVKAWSFLKDDLKHYVMFGRYRLVSYRLAKNTFCRKNRWSRNTCNLVSVTKKWLKQKACLESCYYQMCVKCLKPIRLFLVIFVALAMTEFCAHSTLHTNLGYQRDRYRSTGFCLPKLVI